MTQATWTRAFGQNPALRTCRDFDGSLWRIELRERPAIAIGVPVDFKHSPMPFAFMRDGTEVLVDYPEHSLGDIQDVELGILVDNPDYRDAFIRDWRGRHMRCWVESRGGISIGLSKPPPTNAYWYVSVDGKETRSPSKLVGRIRPRRFGS